LPFSDKYKKEAVKTARLAELARLVAEGRKRPQKYKRISETNPEVPGNKSEIQVE
jgi:hypothetical protein